MIFKYHFSFQNLKKTIKLAKNRKEMGWKSRFFMFQLKNQNVHFKHFFQYVMIFSKLFRCLLKPLFFQSISLLNWSQAIKILMVLPKIIMILTKSLGIDKMCEMIILVFKPKHKKTQILSPSLLCIFQILMIFLQVLKL